MSTFIDTIRQFALYASTHTYASAIDNIAKQIKDFLARYPATALQDISSINNLEELEQIKAILDSLKENLGLDISNSIHTAIDNRKHAINTIRQLGRNFQELLDTERELSKRASSIADLLKKYQMPLTAIAKNANFIPKAIEAYKTLQETDLVFSCLAKIDLKTLDDICDFAHKLRFDIGQSENFGRRIAAILDITLSYSKIEYLTNTLLQDQTVVELMSQDEKRQLKNWPIAPMQRLPRLLIFPKEINEIIDKLSSNPTVIAEQANAIKEMKAKTDYFFKEKISTNTLRLNQAKKAIDFKLQLQEENSNYYLNSISKLFFNAVIQWETEETPELGPVFESVKKSITGSANLGNPTHRPLSRLLAMSSKPSSRMTEISIPIFDNYPERLDRITEPLLAIQQRSFTSPRRPVTSTLNGEELHHFHNMVSAIKKRQTILSGELQSVTSSTQDATNKSAKRKAMELLPQPTSKEGTRRITDFDHSVHARKEAAHTAQYAASTPQQANASAGSTKIPLQDIEAAIDLLNTYCEKLKTIDPSITETSKETKQNSKTYNNYHAANEMTAALSVLLKSRSKTDYPGIDHEIYDLIKFITDDTDTAKTQDVKLQKIMQFEEKFCPFAGTDIALAALKALLVAAVGFVFGVVIASSAVIIAAAATGVAPPLTIAGITACLTTGWSIYAASGGAVLGTIVGASIGIKYFFFSKTAQQNFVAAASTFVKNDYPALPHTPTNGKA